MLQIVFTSLNEPYDKQISAAPFVDSCQAQFTATIIFSYFVNYTALYKSGLRAKETTIWRREGASVQHEIYNTIRDEKLIFFCHMGNNLVCLIDTSLAGK